MRDGFIELASGISPKRIIFSGRTKTTSDIWLTPPYILEALGKFDLDPCASTDRPWDTAKHHYTKEDDGLKHDWAGRIFLNPPYGKELKIWLERLAKHGNGIALVPARTDTKWFHSLVWQSADGVFFKKGRIKFFRENGELGKQPSFPPCLIAYGQSNADILRNLNTEKLNGRYLDLKNHCENGQR